MLLVALGCAAFATQGLHTGVRVADWLIGIGLVVLPMLVVFVILGLVTAILVWFLRFVGRHIPERPARVVTWPVGLLRVVGHPLFATTITVTWLVWGSPDSGPLALYHSMFFFEIPVAVGALVGLLAGAAWGVARLDPRPRHATAAIAVPLVPALVIALAVGGWALLPGLGDPIVIEQADAVASLPVLALADPSAPGPYAVEFASYGSGTDGRRVEYGSAVDWVTPTVDASHALPSREFPDDLYASWFWGFDDTQLPLNALVWYPRDASGRLPLALIVHGNHDAGDYSDPGYGYLCDSLASHGIICASIDENFLNGDSFYDYAGAEMGVRAWFLLRHLDQFRTWDATPGNPLYGRVDLDRVALMGHSRGGEAATLAAAIGASPQGRVQGMPEPARGFGIRAVVAIAPSAGMDHSGTSPSTPANVDYLLLQGARDADLPGYTGLQTYHRISVAGDGDHLKAAVYIGRANHGRFNSVWDYGDAGPLDSWLLERGSLLSMDEQQRVAKTVIGAFLERSLLAQTGYDAFFRDPRMGREWLPADVLQTHWETSGRTTVESFTAFDSTRLVADGFDRPRSTEVPLRDRTVQNDRAVLLTWSGPASLIVPVDAAALSVDPSDTLVFSMVDGPDTSGLSDPTVTLTASDGSTSSVRLSDVEPARPLLPVRLWKIDGVGDRYLYAERLSYPAERFMQTYGLPLDAFVQVQPGLDLTHLSSITFSFEGAGSIYLDDVGFEAQLTTATSATT